MPKIEKVSWGKVKIDGKKYGQVLIIGDQVIERDSDKLHRLFGTTHQIGDWEEKLLLSGDPEVIVIGTGWNGVLKVNLKNKTCLPAGRLKILKTPAAAKEYNRLVNQGIKVNALIHTTC